MKSSLPIRETVYKKKVSKTLSKPSSAHSTKSDAGKNPVSPITLGNNVDVNKQSFFKVKDIQSFVSVESDSLSHSGINPSDKADRKVLNKLASNPFKNSNRMKKKMTNQKILLLNLFHRTIHFLNTINQLIVR